MSAEARPEETDPAARTIWILTHERLGDLRQMERLAKALGWKTLVKRLAFRPPNIPILARLLFNRGRSDPIETPWPDLVLCAEARTSVIARFIRERSRGEAKIVCLGRPSGSPARFDLVLTTAQYRLPKTRQVVELALPISADDPEPIPAPVPIDLDKAARPIVLALVGGTSPPEQLDQAAAERLAEALLAYLRQSGGTLVAITSPRTGRAASDVIARRIVSPHIVHIWQGEAANPYRQFLALADEIIVTSDSISMAAEALATGKPVSIYRLPRRWTLAERVVEHLYRLTSSNPASPPWLKPVRWLFDSGLIEVLPNRPSLFTDIEARGHIRWFGSKGAPLVPYSSDVDLRIAAAHVHRLVTTPYTIRSSAGAPE